MKLIQSLFIVSAIFLVGCNPMPEMEALKQQNNYYTFALIEADTVNGADTVFTPIPRVFGRKGTLTIQYCINDTVAGGTVAAGDVTLLQLANNGAPWDDTDLTFATPTAPAAEFSFTDCETTDPWLTTSYQYGILETSTDPDTFTRSIYVYWQSSDTIK